jgi:DNA-binding transcriptional LysR family regulator
MNWDHFEVFCRVVEHGSFTGAAEAIEWPKSRVSAAIAQLEADLGARLLQRTTRRLSLTEAGEALYHSVAPLFQRLHEVAAETLAHGNSMAGTIRIASPYEFGAHHLAAVACVLMTRYPALRIDIDVEHSAVDFFGRRYDIVFSMAERALPDSSTVARPVVALERGLFASPEFIAQHGLPAEPDALAQLPLLIAPLDKEWSFTSNGGAISRVPIAAPRMASSNADIRLQAAVAGLGVARITASFCEPAVHRGQLRKVLGHYRCEPLRIYAVLPARRLIPAKVRALLDALAAAHPGLAEGSRVAS